MSIIDVFSANLNALTEGRKDLDSQIKLGKVAGVGATNIGRFKRGSVAAQIDSVEKVAKVFKLRACDILDPDLKHRLENGEPLRMGEPRPPAMAEGDWRALSPRTRAFVEDLCTLALSGALQDTDVAWLHDSMQRTARPAAAPDTPQQQTADKPLGAPIAPEYLPTLQKLSHEAEQHANGKKPQRRRTAGQ